MPDSSADEIELKGGIANAGAVTRVGETVRRPAAPHLPFVQHFMRHLRNEGCGFVPEPQGIDDAGREMLAFLPGEAAHEPWPAWLASDDLLHSVAETQGQLHRAAASYVPQSDAQWATTAGDYFPPGSAGTLMCHNDFSVTNTIVDPSAERVVGVIDWDFAAPVDPLFDIMVTARHWLPLAPPEWRVPCLRDVDVAQRLALFADAHELSAGQQNQLITMAGVFIEQAGRNIVALAAEAGPDSGYQALLDRNYLQSVKDTLAWLPGV